MKPILIYIKNQNSCDGLFRVLEQLVKKGHTEVFVTGEDQNIKPDPRYIRRDLPIRPMSLRVAAQYRWAAVVSTHLPAYKAARNGPLMIIPHGTGFGIGGAYHEFLASNCDVYFAHSPNELKYLKGRLGQQFPEDRFVASGVPSTDDLAEYVGLETSARCELKQELGLNPDIPVILVSSHWTPDSVLRTWGCGALAALESFAADYSIVQIAHQGIWDNPEFDTYNPRKDVYGKPEVFNSKILFDELSAYCKDREQVHFLPDARTAKALAVADLLIGDYSSIIVEYCIMDRPIVFTNRPERFFSEINYQRYAAACGAAGSLEQLAHVVAQELASPQLRSEARQALAGEFIFNLGTAAATVAGEILERI